MALGRRAIALVLVVAASCGGEDASALGSGDYFTQLARVSQNAHIQERGLSRDLHRRLDEAEPGAALDVVDVYVGQSARLYQDVVDALTELEPVEGLGDPHAAYLAAWQEQLDLVVKLRNAAFDDVTEYLDALSPGGSSPFARVRDETRARCEALEEAAAQAGRQIDLACRGRPSS